MAKRKRNIQILFCVSPEEKKLIRRKMIESKTKNMGAYLRKMASIKQYLLGISHSILGSITNGIIFTSANIIILQIIEQSNSKFA